jgi:hypothetical protein
MRLSRYVLEIEPQSAESRAQDFVSFCEELFPYQWDRFHFLSRKEFYGIEIVPYKIIGLMKSYMRISGIEWIKIVK